MKEVSLNFGAIKDTVSRLSAHEIIKESKNNTLKSFIAEIKKNPVLLKQHLLFKNITEAKPFKDKTFLAERFIQQNLNLFKNIKWQDIISENRRIRKKLLENYHVEANSDSQDQLYNDIHILLESVTRPGYLKIQESEEAYDRVINYLMSERKNNNENVIKEKYNKDTETPSLTNWKIITKLAVNNFNKRYEHLNEEDKKIFKYLIDTDSNKLNHIQDLKESNLKMIASLIDKEEDIKNIKLLESFKTKLLSEVQDIDNSLIEFYNLNKTLKELI